MNQTMQRPVTRSAVGTYLWVTHLGGMTLRMAGEIVKRLQPLDVHVTFVHRGNVADATSIMAMVCLYAGYGSKVYIWATGPDAPLAAEIVAKAFAGGFGPKDEPAHLSCVR